MLTKGLNVELNTIFDTGNGTYEAFLAINDSIYTETNGINIYSETFVSTDTIDINTPSYLGGEGAVQFQIKGLEYRLTTQYNTIEDEFSLDEGVGYPENKFQTITMNIIANGDYWKAALFDEKPALFSYVRRVGDRRYELSNHLGNVLSVVSDKKIPKLAGSSLQYFNPDVKAYNDYYPFGMLLPGRHANTSGYRYGFQGQEMDDEIKGEGNSINYTFRMHDPRVGRFFARDPLESKYPWYSPYSFSGNKVIAFKELEGAEEMIATLTRDNDFPVLRSTTGEKLVVEFFMWGAMKQASNATSNYSYALAFKKLDQGYLMGSNGRLYTSSQFTIAEEIIDGRVVAYRRGINKGNQWFSTSDVNQVKNFKSRFWSGASNNLSRFSRFGGPSIDAYFFIKNTTNSGEIDGLGLLNLGLYRVPLFGAVMGEVESLARTEIDKYNSHLVNHLENGVVNQGVNSTQSYLSQKGGYVALKDYRVVAMSPTTLAAYLSEQITEFKSLMNFDRQNLENDSDFPAYMLLKYDKKNDIYEVRAIFIDDNNAEKD